MNILKLPHPHCHNIYNVYSIMCTYIPDYRACKYHPGNQGKYMYDEHVLDICMFCVTDGDLFTYTRHEPVGVCGQIIPVCHH